MRTQKKVIGALGAAFGLVIALTAVAAPASARPAPAPAPTVTATLSCASFEGVKVVGSSAGFSSVGLQAGEILSVTVSPAVSGDKVQVIAVSGVFDINASDGAATGPVAFKAPSTTVYSLGWSYILADSSSSTESRTWTFDCSSSTTPAAAPPATTIVTEPVVAPAPVKGHGKSRGK
ncbi:hypothetical protein [Microbacterium sp. P5_E9]